MGRYRKVDTRIWNDEKFRVMSDNGKLVFFFLMTHPHMTALGAMRASVPGLAAEIGHPEKGFREAFGEALSKGMAKHDPEASFLWLPKFLKYNRPESPNVVKAWGDALDLLPECALKVQLIQHTKAFAEALPEAFAKALPEAFAKSMPYQEQEQEQDKREEKIPTPAARRFAPPTLEEVIAYCAERKNSVSPTKWHAHYTANGWKVGKNPMKDWRAAVRTWEESTPGAAAEKPAEKKPICSRCGKTARMEVNRRMWCSMDCYDLGPANPFKVALEAAQA